MAANLKQDSVKVTASVKIYSQPSLQGRGATIKTKNKF